MKRLNLLTGYSQWFFFLVGTTLLIVGGVVYSIPPNSFISFALFLLVLGVSMLLQASLAFQPSNVWKLVFSILFSTLLIIFIDWWPVQLFYSRIVANLLGYMGIISMEYFLPHFGGAQIRIFVNEAVTMRVVGGEIDNACAGLIALIPCLLLLLLAERKISTPNRIAIVIIAICIIVLGNLFRIFIELWAPAVGLAPFELVHYPLAFILGYFGMIVITVLGQRLIKHEEKTE